MLLKRIGRYRVKLFTTIYSHWDFRLIDTKNGQITTAPTTYRNIPEAMRDAEQIVASNNDQENFKPYRLFFSDGSSVFIGRFRRQRIFQQKRR